MNKYFYDVSTNAFYPIAMKEIYESNGMNFDNAKEVDEKLFIEYSGEPPKGKIRIASEDGFPGWGDIPPPTKDELIANANQKKISLIADAQRKINIWQTELTLGLISDEDKNSLVSWLKYIKAVQNVDISKAPDLIWPNHP
ncbi:TPA: tail fiber assembly protein [Enterobacter asburiae]|uniref:tail fiber assembly protein n=1 Tax=Enterobacter asburiae TaxID=61645 RepID=UPI001F451C79|nr:tail fiber assembly protein [Enterobacter asburiae]MCF1340496.1 tail fiber assembly protein [Enterobacter asburiae]MCQ4338875.1 tail fiber assembly protein [Enterobacter asburiae]HDC4533313.1 tail fiber assembly protein [Enterobacter asburiae]HDC4565155.1 tail fiber assembly protein [Enterobacter asburiae]